MSIERAIASTRRSISATNQRLEAAEDELAALRRELSGLQGAESDVRGDKQVFYRQLGEKRSHATRAANVSTARYAQEFSSAMNAVLGSVFERNIASNFDGFIGQIRRAISDVEAEIRQKQAQINSLRSQIRQLNAQLTAQERVAAEERARENR